MYRWIYHHLPGPRPLRIMLLAALLAAVLILLFQHLFPYIAQFSQPGSTNTVG